MSATATDRLNGITTNVAIKAPCKVAATSNVSLVGEQTIVDTPVVAGDRVLLTAQADATENGIWVVSTTSWSRAKDFDGNRDVVYGTLVSVAGRELYRVTTPNPIVIQTSEITFERAGADEAANVSYTPAGSGAVATDVQTKLRELGVSIADQGAVEGGVEDVGPAFQKALDVAAGGVVLIPPGRWRKAKTSPKLVVPSGTTILGYGDTSELFFDDDPALPRVDLLDCGGAANVAFRNFRISGTALTHPEQTNQSQALTGTDIDGLRVEGVTFEKLRYMATAFSKVKRGQIIGNKLDYIVRDGLRCTNSDNVIVAYNVLRRVADDAIALHSKDDQAVPGAGFTVIGNLLEQCQGVKVLGAKIITITNNIFRRTLRNPIDVRVPMTGTEGNSPMFSVSITGNVITDTFGTYGTDFTIRVTGGSRDDGGLTSQPGVNASPLSYNYLNDIDAAGVRPGAWAIRICDNTIARTLKSVAAFSDWGYGERFDRTVTGFVDDPAVADTDFSAHGIQVYAPLQGLLLRGNQISGLNAGRYPMLFSDDGAANLQDVSDTLIEGNQVIDCIAPALYFSGSGSGAGSRQVKVFNNIFDLDPFFRAAGHNADNTWAASTSLPAIGNTSAEVIAIVTGGNTFKNLSATNVGTGSGFAEALYPNVVYADFTASGDNAANKGVRRLPPASTNLIIPIDGDPTSSTFGQVQNMPLLCTNTMPAAGRYVAGHVVKRNTPSIAGSAGSQYLNNGWWRATTGGGHVAGTDWFEMRTLTGT